MAWASVSWAYKDLISSAKLAQMVENLRVHDHKSTDQGSPSVALGRVASVVKTSGNTTTTTAVDVPSLAVTFTAVAGRLYRVTLAAAIFSSVAGDLVNLSVQEGATVLGTARGVAAAASNIVTSLGTVIELAGVSAGSHTYKVVLTRAGGTGTVGHFSAVDSPSLLAVDDLGV